MAAAIPPQAGVVAAHPVAVDAGTVEHHRCVLDGDGFGGAVIGIGIGNRAEVIGHHAGIGFTGFQDTAGIIGERGVGAVEAAGGRNRSRSGDAIAGDKGQAGVKRIAENGVRDRPFGDGDGDGVGHHLAHSHVGIGGEGLVGRSEGFGERGPRGRHAGRIGGVYGGVIRTAFCAGVVEERGGVGQSLIRRDGGVECHQVGNDGDIAPVINHRTVGIFAGIEGARWRGGRAGIVQLDAAAEKPATEVGVRDGGAATIGDAQRAGDKRHACRQVIAHAHVERARTPGVFQDDGDHHLITGVHPAQVAVDRIGRQPGGSDRPRKGRTTTAGKGHRPDGGRRENAGGIVRPDDAFRDADDRFLELYLNDAITGAAARIRAALLGVCLVGQVEPIGKRLIRNGYREEQVDR